MADRGIIFSAPMVLALLDDRKNQTRRIAGFIETMAAGRFHVRANGGGIIGLREAEVPEAALDFAPYAVGDRLYVREHWKTRDCLNDTAPRDMSMPGEPIWYLADGERRLSNSTYHYKAGRHRQAMHMPRWASRLTLIVTDVRVQRLQDICNSDAEAEGLYNEIWEVEDRDHNDMEHVDGWSACEKHAFKQGVGASAREGFEILWDSLHTEEPKRWKDNPWVCVISFDVIKCNIDQIDR